MYSYDGAELKHLIQLNKSHIEPATAILVRAFRNYPLLQASFSDELQRRRLAPYFFRYALYYGIQYGETYATTPNLEGVAVWIPSANFPVTFWRAVRSVPVSVIVGFGREGGGRMKYAGEYMDTTHKRLAPFKHWLLQTIGVDPQFQGKGHAGELLRPMFARTDKEGLPCYLETLDEQNISLYEHFGFKVVEKGSIPNTSLTSWAMLREIQ